MGGGHTGDTGHNLRGSDPSQGWHRSRSIVSSSGPWQTHRHTKLDHGTKNSLAQMKSGSGSGRAGEGDNKGPPLPGRTFGSWWGWGGGPNTAVPEVLVSGFSSQDTLSPLWATACWAGKSTWPTGTCVCVPPLSPTLPAALSLGGVGGHLNVTPGSEANRDRGTQSWGWRWPQGPPG